MQKVTKGMIQNFSLFEGILQEEKEKIAKLASKKTLPAKQIFIEQGSPSDAVYFIVEGSVNVYRMNENGEEISLGILGTGDVVGEMALIDHELRSAFVKTLTDTTFFVLTRNDFVALLQEHPNIAIKLLSSLSKRIRETDLHMEELMTQNLETRTWNTLQILRRYFTGNEIALTHEELALIIGATRARVTKILDSLQKKGLVSLSHRKITLP